MNDATINTSIETTDKINRKAKSSIIIIKNETLTPSHQYHHHNTDADQVNLIIRILTIV